MTGRLLDADQPYVAAPGALVAPHALVLREMTGVSLGNGISGGPGLILGQSPGLTTYDGAPGPARVYLIDRKTMQLVQATRSRADGTYGFRNLALNREYVVLAVDPDDQDNAVVMDRVQAGIPED